MPYKVILPLFRKSCPKGLHTRGFSSPKILDAPYLHNPTSNVSERCFMPSPIIYAYSPIPRDFLFSLHRGFSSKDKVIAHVPPFCQHIIY